MTTADQASNTDNNRQRAFEHLQDALVIVDLFTGNILDANSAAESLFKTSREFLIGRAFDSLIPAGDNDSLLENINACGPQLTGLQYQRPDGETILVDVMVCFIPGEREDQVVFSFRDAEHRLRYEREIERARREAEAALRVKSAFLASMSHEVRTPINGIMGMTELMLSRARATEDIEALEIIRTSSENLHNLLNDVLDLSRMEAGTKTLNLSEFSLRSCLEEVLDIVAERAQKKNLNLGYAMDPETPLLVAGDRGRLQQILINLVTNAVKFTDQGYVFLRASCNLTASRPVFDFLVEDTGRGIDPARVVNRAQVAL